MAEYLASIFGTDKDKVNCSFYFKIGACRHGDACSRVHSKPAFSQTILLRNLYHNPELISDLKKKETMTPAEAQETFDDFFEEVFTEIEDKYGEVEEVNVCDNISEHLLGNTYIKFRYEESAQKAVKKLNNRWFDGRPIVAELSPVTDFREACCRQYETGECTRGGFCNFMHLKPISRELRKELYTRKHPWRYDRKRKRPYRIHRRKKHDIYDSSSTSSDINSDDETISQKSEKSATPSPDSSGDSTMSRSSSVESILRTIRNERRKESKS